MKALSEREREAIFLRDGYRCVYCGVAIDELPYGHRMGLVLDHVIPVAFGGAHSPENLATACWRCNSAKRCQIWPRAIRPYLELEVARQIANKLPRQLHRYMGEPVPREAYFDWVMRLAGEIDIYGVKGVHQLREHELFPDQVPMPVRL